MKNICIIGAGQLGSRHLQALKSVKEKLNIYVVDLNEESLIVAKERYEAISLPDENKVHFIQGMEKINEDYFDVVIISTNSNARKKVTNELLSLFEVKFIIFEKILFQKENDFYEIEDVLIKKKVRAFVNCSMRMMPFYRDIKNEFIGSSFKYLVSGSQFGLVTNLIHYLDHMAYLNGNTDFIGNTSFLDKRIIESKRKGFKELTGTYIANFRNGTQGIFTCFPTGNSPIIIQAFNDKIHFISKESEGKVWISREKNNWKWEEIEFSIPYQSQLTTELIEDLIQKQTCNLPTFQASLKVHIPMLESLNNFINAVSNEKYEYYPFT